MKKIYMLMIALLCGGGAFAQVLKHIEIDPLDPALMPARAPHVAATRSPSMRLDYDTADAIGYNAAQLHTIQFVMNKRFVSNPPSTAATFKYYIIRFDSLYDVDNQIAFPNDQVNNILLDSLYAILGHQNVSGQPDTFVFKVLNLGADHYPGDTVLRADTFYTTASKSPSNNWHNPFGFVWKPNFLMNRRNFCVELDYYGDLRDTCAFVAGFSNLGAPPPPYNLICPYRANFSLFYPVSFGCWTDNGLLPDRAGNDIIQDCNLSGAFEPTYDGFSFIQTIVMGAYITINSTAAVEDLKNLGVGLTQNYPNPAHTMTNITYEIANNVKDVTLSVYDVVGSKVMEIKEGSKVQGNYTISLDASRLSKGMYTYTLRADGRQLTRKMIVE